MPFLVSSQELNHSDISKKLQKKLDSNNYIISKNIYRLTIAVPMKDLSYYVPDVMLLGNYEHALYKNVSIVANLGVRMGNKSFGVYVSDPVTSYHFTGTGEVRFYYALLNREKKFRPTINFSGSYISLNQYVLAKPFAIYSKSKLVSEKDAAPSQAGLYFNIGYQRQYKQFYFNCFLGVLLVNETNKSTIRYDGALPAGLSIGYVFK